MTSRTAAAVVAVALCLAAPDALAQQEGAILNLSPTAAPDIPGVVAGGTMMVIIRQGLTTAEGPVATADGSVLVADPNSKKVWRVDQNDQFSVFLENTNAALSLVLDAKGRLLVTETVPGRGAIAAIYPEDAAKTLADSVEGAPISRPNELVVSSKGDVYFTNPGMTPGQQAASEKTLGRTLGPYPPPAVYYIPARGGSAVKVADGIERPNGLQLSRDEKTLYVNNTNGVYMLAFDVRPDGMLTNRRNFASYQARAKNSNGVPGIVTGADGLVIDSEDRLYAVTDGGVEVFSPNGQRLGTIPTPGRPQNLCFAGPDKKTLYVVGDGRVFKIQMLAQGFKGRAK